MCLRRRCSASSSTAYDDDLVKFVDAVERRKRRDQKKAKRQEREQRQRQGREHESSTSSGDVSLYMPRTGTGHYTSTDYENRNGGSVVGAGNIDWRTDNGGDSRGGGESAVDDGDLEEARRQSDKRNKILRGKRSKRLAFTHT
jgi:hypothetical protein